MAARVDLNRDQTILGDLRNFTRLREIVNPSQDEVRLHAAAVRRLLLDGVLAAAAGSRKIALTFKVPDAMPLVRAARNDRLVMYTLGGMEVFGIFARHGALWVGPSAHADGSEIRDVNLKLDSFLRQPVAFCSGTTLTRHDVIVYVANKAGGVHYDPKETAAMPNEKLVAFGRLRRNAKMGIVDGVTTINMTPPGWEEDQSDHFRYEPEYIDAVYLEFLAALQFILDSEPVQDLREAIEGDLSG